MTLKDHLSNAEASEPLSSQALTCIGETAAAGGVFIGLGLSGVRGLAAAAGVGTRKPANKQVHHKCIAAQHKLL